MTTNTFKEETNFEKPLKTKSISSSGSVIVSGDLEVNGNSYIKNISASTITSPSITSKQDKLVSGTNIKTINGGTLLGSGNISVITSVSDKVSKWGDTMFGSFSIDGTLNVGDGCTSSGDYSFAQGSGSTASGRASHAEGGKTQANGSFSHTEGFLSIATGFYGHAEGNNTNAEGVISHAEGDSTQAIGNSSHAEGDSTQAIGNSSHAEGDSTQANSSFSHTEGKGTITYNLCEHASGLYNISTLGSTGGDETALSYDSVATLFSIGNGSSNTARNNAFEVKGNGDIYVKGRDGTKVRLQDVING